MTFHNENKPGLDLQGSLIAHGYKNFENWVVVLQKPGKKWSHWATEALGLLLFQVEISGLLNLRD